MTVICFCCFQFIIHVFIQIPYRVYIYSFDFFLISRLCVFSYIKVSYKFPTLKDKVPYSSYKNILLRLFLELLKAEIRISGVDKTSFDPIASPFVVNGQAIQPGGLFKQRPCGIPQLPIHGNAKRIQTHFYGVPTRLMRFSPRESRALRKQHNERVRVEGAARSGFLK